MTLTQFVQSQLQAPVKRIETTLKLLSEDCTFPFIARYRKNETRNLDEVQMKEIFKLNKQFEDIQKRKESILKSIEEQGQLSAELH
jgi:protein Tex